MTDLRNDTVTVYEYDYVGRFSGVNEYSTEDYYYNTTSKVTYDKQSKVTKRVLNISYNILDVADKSFNATETTSYVYDEENRLSSWTVSISKSLTQSLTYDDFDRVSKITNVSDGGFYNEVSYGYNNSSSWKIDSYTSKVGTSSSNTTITYEYEYDYKGNIISIETSDGKDVSYEYDEIGQLIRENNQKLGKTYVYTYNSAGNILFKEIYNYSTSEELDANDLIYVNDGEYHHESWGDLLTSYNGAPITYDGIGNPLTYYNGTDYTFTWEGRRLKTATKGNQNFTFTYNVDGIRTSKTVNGVEHIYTLNGSQIVSEEWDGYLMVYIYDTNGAPIGMNFRNIRTATNSGIAYWFEKNLQGDIVAVYDNNGIKYAEYDYDAWGNCTTTYFNNGGVTAAMFNPFRYRGYYYDADLGLYYLNSRYYDSNIARFINADGYVSTGTGLVGYNMFAYCNNNPIMYFDTLGYYPAWLPDWVIYLYETITSVEAQKAHVNLQVQEKITSAFTDNSSFYVGAGAGSSTDFGVAEYTVKAEQGMEITTDGIKKGEFGTNVAALKFGPISFTYGNKEFTPEDGYGEYTKSNNDWDIVLSYGEGFGIIFCWEISFSISLRGVWNSFMGE